MIQRSFAARMTHFSFCRCMRTAVPAADKKGLLMRLRKESGFPFTKCKSALEESELDISRAHSLLQEWAKADASMLANKLAARSTKEGLLTVLTHKSQALLVEVNCETDFVSRNELFQNFALNSLSSIFSSTNYKNAQKSDVQQIQVPIDDITELGHLKSEVLPLLKESIVFGRCFKLGEESTQVSIHAAVHPKIKDFSIDTKGPVGQFGKFVALVAVKPKQEGVDVDPSLANQLAYHVIGMSPEVLHASEIRKKESQQSEESRPQMGELSESEDEESQRKAEDSQEFVEQQLPMPDDSIFSDMSEALYEQKFLFDPNRSISEICELNNIEIVSFHRFELK